jgi:hypothetical protein
MTKSNKTPGKISNLPQEFRCRRGENKEGCGSDPRFNSSNQPWAESEVGKMWKAAGYDALPKDVTITLKNAKERRISFSPNKANSNKGNQPGRYAYMVDACKDLLLTSELIPFSLSNVQDTRRKAESGSKHPRDSADSALAASLLLDTGAIGACVVSDSYLAIMNNSNFSFKSHKINHELNSALNDNTISNLEVSFTIYLNSENNHSTETIAIPIRAVVAPIGVDLILDKATIKKYKLVQHFPSHFAEGDTLEWLKQLPNTKQSNDSTIPAAVPIEHTLHTFATSVSSPKGTAWGKQLKRHKNIHHREWMKAQREMFAEICQGLNKTQASYLMTFSARLDELKKTHTITDDLIRSTLANLTSNFSKKPAFEREGNLTGIPDNKLESIPAELVSGVHSVNDFKKVHIEGGPLVQTELAKLVEEFKDIFRTSVQNKPANLKPFKLEVDTTKWELPANQLRCRKLDREREVELAKMIEILIDADIIEACDAAYYSHAFLVPKPNGKWRLVLDFKNLNGATINYYKWPLPDIKEMLNRVGDSRPEFFAVFDLTSGYYQAEIDEDSREFTAFLTRNGVYRWLRLPMGLTGACSYFQKSLVTQVLRGLMHDGCELYLDDCMIHAPTLDIYLKRLRQVFLRFRENNITLNPLKCRLGLPKVEFVGHTIDKNGLHFTRDKLDSVLNFPRPETKRQIKSFIGLANYFRDHIKNHSIRAQPLQDFVNGYDKSQARQRIKWTPESEAAFEDLRAAIDDCPMLWFMDDYSPIYLQTDASDYGIGAYLYQKVTQEDGTIVEQPIGFVSKSIASEHQSWDTPMKEGFAIFYALHKWEYLLRDREFTILTDHQNLTRLRADHSSNKMVKRWFLCFQEFDIKEWKYVKGEDNMVPDQFSRLCPELEDIHPASLLCQLTGYEVPTEHWDNIAKFHNSGIKGTVPNAKGDGVHMGCPGGHGGVERTLSQLDKAGLQWHHRKKHVRHFIKLCPCCQKMDQMKRVIHSYPFTLSSYGLWNTVSVDYIERLIPDEYGNNMVIVIIDNFSRFTCLYPTSSTNAQGAADALLSFCGSYVTPMHFTTDSGANFKSTLIAGLLERLGSDHFLTAAYSKEMNGLVERQNKEVLRHLRNIIFDHRTASKWSKYLPLVQRIINASKNASTGLAPAEIVFPNGIQLDKSILTENSSVHLSSYIQDLQQSQGRILALAEESLRSMDQKHMEQRPAEVTVFADGQYVLAEHRHNSLRRGPKSKLLPFLKGPMQVKQHNPATGIYVLQDLVTAKVLDYHVSRLRPFLYDERTCTPLQAALTDTLDEFVVEEVIRMRGDPRRSRKDLEFKVRWAGYGPNDDTWEPWEHCRDSDAVQQFLRAHPNRRVQRLAKPIEAPQADEQEDANSEMSEDDQ